MILCGGVTLRGAVIKGNLYIAESCAGSVDLTDTTVEGSIVIMGSASRTLTLRSSTVHEIELRPDAANTRIIIENGTRVDLITVNAPAEIEVAGGGYVNEIRNYSKSTPVRATKKSPIPCVSSTHRVLLKFIFLLVLSCFSILFLTLFFSRI